MPGFDYDLFVIGGGSGGVRAGRLAASMGKRVAIAEEYRFGGTCVIRGCVPKKLFVYASQFPEHFEDAAGYGWTVGETRFDWPTLIANKDREIARLEAIYRRGLENAGAEIVESRAVLEGPHAVRIVGQDRTVTARHILIATGGTPFVPPEFDGLGAMTSNEVFGMEELPRSILIIGGGFIACEFACLLQGLGVSVTQLYRGAQILRGFDDDLRHTVAAEMGVQGVTLEVGTDLVSLEKLQDGRFAASDTNGGRREFDRVLFATGRVPNTRGLGLEEAGVLLAEGGAVQVDEWSQSNIPSVYAVGDVTDRIQLTPVAIREGHAFADTVFGGKPSKADHALVASAVFTSPEAATVGLTEEAAAEAGPVKIYMTSFTPMQTAFAGGTTKAMMKLVVCGKSDRVLGCHIVAPGAAEMIQFAAVAMKMGATKADFDRAVAVHPTMAEEIVLLRKPVREHG